MEKKKKKRQQKILKLWIQGHNYWLLLHTHTYLLLHLPDTLHNPLNTQTVSQVNLSANHPPIKTHETLSSKHYAYPNRMAPWNTACLGRSLLMCQFPLCTNSMGWDKGMQKPGKWAIMKTWLYRRKIIAVKKSKENHTKQRKLRSIIEIVLVFSIKLGASWKTILVNGWGLPTRPWEC